MTMSITMPMTSQYVYGEEFVDDLQHASTHLLQALGLDGHLKLVSELEGKVLDLTSVIRTTITLASLALALPLLCVST